MEEDRVAKGREEELSQEDSEQRNNTQSDQFGAFWLHEGGALSGSKKERRQSGHTAQNAQ